MTFIYLTKYNTEFYAVTSQNNGWIKVRKLRDIGNDERITYEVNPIEIFVGKSKLCDMTKFSGAMKKHVFDGNTILLKIGEGNNKNKYFYIGGDMICSFLTNDNIYEYISNMNISLTPYSIATREENYCFLAPNFKFF